MRLSVPAAAKTNCRMSRLLTPFEIRSEVPIELTTRFKRDITRLMKDRCKEMFMIKSIEMGPKRCYTDGYVSVELQIDKDIFHVISDLTQSNYEDMMALKLKGKPKYNKMLANMVISSIRSM